MRSRRLWWNTAGVSKDELSSFKIGDLKRPEVKSFKRGSASKSTDPEPEAASVGFPAVESRLESGTAESLAEELRPSYEKLEELATGGDMKQRAAAKKALIAYERTADLFEYLYATKDSIGKGGG